MLIYNQIITYQSLCNKGLKLFKRITTNDILKALKIGASPVLGDKNHFENWINMILKNEDAICSLQAGRNSFIT